jgi:hypothetical protein
MYNEYERILPINGADFAAWKAKVLVWPIPTQGSTLLLYELEFNAPAARRRLKLWVPKEVLVVERRQQQIFDSVRLWLEGQDGDGELRPSH